VFLRDRFFSHAPGPTTKEHKGGRNYTNEKIEKRAQQLAPDESADKSAHSKINLMTGSAGDFDQCVDRGIREALRFSHCLIGAVTGERVYARLQAGVTAYGF